MMMERRKIVELWRDCGPAVLATLIHVEGSSYRRAGARLLLADDGRYAGAISGGCLEAELIRKARWAVRHGAVVQRYSTLFDDTADIPYGLGCGGTVDVLLEPSGTVEFNALMRALAASLEGGTPSVCTWLPAKGEALRRSVDGVFADESGEQVEDSRHFIVEELLPPQRVVVLGAGDDAQPLVRLCAMMGWDVVVADGRAQWARAERFPEATVFATEQLALLAGDAVVVMTHSYEQDREWLVAAIRAQVRYLGLLGSRHRSALLMSEAAAELRCAVGPVCERVFAPVGLDLGGDGAEAIALAVVAEIHAVIEKKLGTAQRMSAVDIAEQIAKGGASRYLQAQCAL
jgi:xanthine/CO dehydrogenase XdhC/CoxF family maturation factor